MNRHLTTAAWLAAILLAADSALAADNDHIASPAKERPAIAGPPVRATNFQSHKVYQSRQHPSYTSWVSFFPGEHGQWYLTCEEVTRPAHPLPGSSPEAYYGMGLPRGYDKAQYLMEVVTLESDDALATWKEIGRQPVRFQHSAGSFGEARTRDGNFLRFVWACYSLDPATRPSEIFYRSTDNARTWEKMPPFVSEHFAWYPHRLRTLRDGTLVLCAARGHKWGPGTDYPLRTSINVNAISDIEMTLFFSFDQGSTWSNPLPILAGQNVSETDFVELPDGNLLFINNNIFAAPGRQFVYREGRRFTPGPLERAQSGTVPETVCLTEDGVLVGCLRPGRYFWSDDLGQNWQPLAGAPSSGEVYQPWIQYVGSGKVACAGHLGYDDPVGARDQYISVHTFQVQSSHKTAIPKLWIEREYDSGTRSFLNSFIVTLTAEGAPLADKDIQVWHVARYTPGYDSYNKLPLAERMKLGGKSITIRTDESGHARFHLPEYDGIKDRHATYQMLVRFNPDRKQYPQYPPAQLPQVEYYANHGLDP